MLYSSNPKRFQRVKLKAANERAAAADKATAAAEDRAKQIEHSFEEYKKHQRETPEAALHQENATLKGELAASESKINKVVQEKNEALFEKEQHRANVHKLVRALKREKQKLAALEEKDRGQLRLEYANRGQCLAVGGNREELHRIRNELNSLGGNNGNPQLPTPQTKSFIPARAAPASMSQQSATSPQKPRPIPSPLTPPTHPTSKRRPENDENSAYICNHSNHLLQSTPPGALKMWNGTALKTRRHVSSDSKLDRLHRERDGAMMMAGPADVNNLLRPEAIR